MNDAFVGGSDSDSVQIDALAANDTVTLTAEVSANNTVLLGDDGGSFLLSGNSRVTLEITDAGADGAANDASAATHTGSGNVTLTGSAGQDTVSV